MTAPAVTSTRGEGPRVLVAGEAGATGLAIAEAFLAEGARVLLFAADEARLAAAQQRLQGFGPALAMVRGSGSDAAAVEEVFSMLDRLWGGLDILINDGGAAAAGPALSLGLPEWRQALDTGLTGPFLRAQAAARRMLPQGSGVILNLASIFGQVAAPEQLAGCTSQSALVMLTKVLAIEWAGQGIRVNAIAPGYLADGPGASGDEAALLRRTPLGRLGQPEEVADLALFLASERAAYITGAVIGCDGGWTAYGYI